MFNEAGSSWNPCGLQELPVSPKILCLTIEKCPDIVDSCTGDSWYPFYPDVALIRVKWTQQQFLRVIVQQLLTCWHLNLPWDSKNLIFLAFSTQIQAILKSKQHKNTWNGINLIRTTLTHGLCPEALAARVCTANHKSPESSVLGHPFQLVPRGHVAKCFLGGHVNACPLMLVGSLQRVSPIKPHLLFLISYSAGS